MAPVEPRDYPIIIIEQIEEAKELCRERGIDWDSIEPTSGPYGATIDHGALLY